MDLNTFTHKAQQAVLAARTEAEQWHHAAAEPGHLLMALLGQGDGIVYPLLSRLTSDTAALKALLADALEAAPRVFGDTEVGFSPALIAFVSNELEILEERITKRNCWRKWTQTCQTKGSSRTGRSENGYGHEVGSGSGVVAQICEPSHGRAPQHQ